MVECVECGKEVQTRFQNGFYISGCWSAVHEPPNISELEVRHDDIFPITGLNCETAEKSMESYLDFWN